MRNIFPRTGHPCELVEPPMHIEPAVTATSTGVITLCRVGSSRVARAAEWSRVPWSGEGRGSGGEDARSSVIRFNYNLL